MFDDTRLNAETALALGGRIVFTADGLHRGLHGAVNKISWVQPSWPNCGICFDFHIANLRLTTTEVRHI